MQYGKKCIRAFPLVCFIIAIIVFSVNLAVDAHSHYEHTLLTDNRDNLEICVMSLVTENVSLQAKNEVASIIQQSVLTHDKWKELYNNIPFTVKDGCDVTPYLSIEGNVHPVLSGEPEPGRIVKKANSSLVAIYIVSEDIIKRNFPDNAPRTAPEELICENHECREVTQGLYFTPEEFNDYTFVTNELLKALSLESEIIKNNHLPVNLGRDE